MLETYIDPPGPMVIGGISFMMVSVRPSVRAYVRTISQNKLMTDYAVGPGGPGGSLNSLNLCYLRVM